MANGSALSALRALSNKEKVEEKSEFASTVNDVAIKGAKRIKTTVHLGLDMEFQGTARKAAEAHEVMERAKSEFEIYQAQVRDYGAEKRLVWNDTFKANDTTMAVPYEVEVVGGGKEVRTVQVVCTNKFSVRDESIKQIRGDLGDAFPRLFEESVEKVLRPNCADLMKGILKDAGLPEEEVDSAMESLFETKTKIKTAKNYEQEVKRVPDGVRAILDQAVTRSAPALKFGE
jgi:hypothetical protein